MKAQDLFWNQEMWISPGCREWSPGGAAQQQLSVVTTVWGVTTSTQSAPQNFGAGYNTQASKTAVGAAFPGPGGYRQTTPGWVTLYLLRLRRKCIRVLSGVEDQIFFFVVIRYGALFCSVLTITHSLIRIGPAAVHLSTRSEVDELSRMLQLGLDGWACPSSVT